uniref:WRKY domain-containing protein n=1 Tax=Salix viminalis TaxID=40686 RepID=A0A6N2ND42_SALVM
MAEDQDWDLYAVVRSCTSAAASAAAATTNKSSSSSGENFESPFDQRLASLTFDGGGDEESSPFSFPNLACQPRNNNCLQELRDSCKPFLPGFTTSAGRRLQGKNTNNNIPSFSISDSGVIFSGQNQAQLAQQQQPSPSTGVAISPWFNNSHKQPPHVQEQQNQRRQLHQQGTSTSSLFPLRTTQSQAPRKKNYYRCSSSKGCAARKQVERSNTDPNMFIVCYTGDHTHPRPTQRNSLAGSTRNKVQQPAQKPENKESEQPILAHRGLCSSSLSATTLSHRTTLSTPIYHIEELGNEQESIKTHNLEGGQGRDDHEDGVDGCDNDIDDDSDDDLLISNMALNEDLIKGFQELVSGNEDGGLSNSPAFGDNFSSPVIGGSASTAAGATGGGGW